MERLAGVDHQSSGSSGTSSSSSGSSGNGLPSALYLCTLICVWAVGSAASSSTGTLYGLHTAELLGGELVVPRRVHADGAFMTHALSFRHAQDHRRQRRSASASSEAELHYQLQLHNETLHLELTAHNYFVAPQMIVERHRRDLRTRAPAPTRHLNCHFHGKVRGQPSANVAISTCAGLVGHIKTPSNDYYIEPSKLHKAHPINGHPHVVFQRSSVKLKQPHKRRRHKRKRKESQRQHNKGNAHGRGHGHGHSISNCGTREPRRRMETRLEWQAQGKVKIQEGRKIRRHHFQQQQQQQPHNKFIYDTAIELPPKQTNSSAPKTQEKRRKRSISTPRHVETLIVADATMVAFHQEVEAYLLTIMNMVSALYKDPSIGNSIEIVVVKIILLEEDEAHPELNLTQNAQKNLDRFCSWQHKLNTANENDPHHHDVAILITRKNICGNNCMTLGLANVGGMCKPKQSCSVNEDNGIMLSHTITHELGHNFGMFHDTAKIGCHPRVGSIVHIMTPTFGADTLQVCWSNCSRKYITHFLDQGLGECLDDPPTPLDEYIYPEALPGERYNAQRQCRMQFNLTDATDVGACSSPHEFCSTLWCRVNGECVTNMRPTAPGTSCGKHKWCQNGKCVRTVELIPIHGGWGNWSEWSECSRSCGGGVSIQQRECNNPVPANGGVFCIGERKRYKICRKKSCPEQEPSFRSLQCARHDNATYQGGSYKWLPFFDKNNPCKLFCTDADDTIIANWGETVLDGTPCTLGTNNMCIDGICKKVGCDWIVDSDLQDDRCGVCGGAGDQCKSVKDIYSESFNVTDGYVEIVTIPARARHIVIKELANSANFLAISRAQSSHFYLNGDSLISMPGEFEIAGAESLYDRLDEQETIKIPQPIQHSIAIHVIVRVNETNEGIYYEFTLPALNITAGRNYHWKLSNWTTCTASCGGGLQYREALCYENGKLIGDKLPCWTHAKNKQPLRVARGCHQQQCPSHWWTGPWQFCPVTCRQAGAAMPLRRRSVVCLDQHDVVVADAQCGALVRPPDSEPCAAPLPECRGRA